MTSSLPLSTMNTCNIVYGNPFTSCQDISDWTVVLDGPVLVWQWSEVWSFYFHKQNVFNWQINRMLLNETVFTYWSMRTVTHHANMITHDVTGDKWNQLSSHLTSILSGPIFSPGSNCLVSAGDSRLFKRQSSRSFRTADIQTINKIALWQHLLTPSLLTPYHFRSPHTSSPSSRLSVSFPCNTTENHRPQEHIEGALV